MKRIALFAISTFAVLVLMFSYRTSTSSTAAAPDSAVIAPISGGGSSSGAPTGTAGSSGGTTDPAAGSGAIADPSSSQSPTAPATSSGTPTSPATAATVTGNVAQTRWGPVQVQITVADGRITDVSVVQYPHENGKDQQINARALPTLIDETLSAQTANIDMVSGATITSEGYLTSLQSAIDQAGI